MADAALQEGLNLNLGGIKTSGQALQREQQILDRQSALQPQLAQAQKEQAEAESQTEIKAAEGKLAAMRESQDKERQADLEARKKMIPNPEFHPTEENAQSLASLFSLVATAGMMIGSSGKLSAQRAMDSMTGMLKGWQAGREDQFKREKDTFDREMTRIKATNDSILKDLEEAHRLAATDREAAMASAELAARKAGSGSVIAAKLKVGDIQGAIEVAKGAEKVVDKIYTHLSAEEQKHADMAYQRETTLMAARERAAASSAKQSVLLSGRAENIREAFVQAAADVENISKFPPKTVLGAFSGMTGQEGATLTSSLADTFARKVSSTESRLLQQLVSGLETNLANALGGGYASSASKARIDQYKSQIPKAGDNGYVAADFLARIKQEMNLLAGNFATKPGATPQMNEAVQAANDRINAAVPFTVDDVLTAYYNKETPPVSPNAGSKGEAPELTEEQYNAAPVGTRYRVPGSKKVLVKQ